MAQKPGVRKFTLYRRAWLKGLDGNSIPVFEIFLLPLTVIWPLTHGLASKPDGHNI